MVSGEIIEGLKNGHDLNKCLETLELITLTFLVGNEDEHLSYELRQEVVDCYLKLKCLLSEAAEEDGRM